MTTKASFMVTSPRRGPGSLLSWDGCQMVRLGPAKSGFSSSWWAAMLLREKQSCRGAFWSTAGCARAASQSPSRPQRSSALDLVANALWNKCHLKSIQPRKSTRCNSSEFFFRRMGASIKGNGRRVASSPVHTRSLAGAVRSPPS